MTFGDFRETWCGIWLAPYLGLVLAAGGCGRGDAPEPEDRNPRQQVKMPVGIAGPGANGNDQPAALLPAQVLPGKEVELEALDDSLSEEEVRRIFKEITKDFDVDAFGDISEHKQRAAEAPPSHVNSMRQAVYNAVFMGRLHQATEASFRISGTITSDKGLPLTDVDVEVTKYGMMGGKTGAESISTGDDATFSIECDGAGRIEIVFTKQGYYDATFVFESGFELDQQKSQDLLTSVCPESVVIRGISLGDWV
ncbi:MAG: carboxypeptidase-like regulatory domain-containing protein, partial [Pirellulales bacterium]